MERRKYKTKAEVLARGQEAVGKTLGEIDKTGRIATGKGAIGTVVEESWFGYKPNSNPAPDFEEAGVELKVTPYRQTPRGIQAKERLVCDMLNYDEEYYKTFDEITQRLKEIAAPGDLILTIGAGDIFRVGEALASAE